MTSTTDVNAGSPQPNGIQLVTIVVYVLMSMLGILGYRDTTNRADDDRVRIVNTERELAKLRAEIDLLRLRR